MVLILHLVADIIQILWGYTLPLVWFGTMWAQGLCTVLGGHLTVAMLKQKRETKRCTKSSQLESSTHCDVSTSVTARTDTPGVKLDDLEMEPRLAAVEGQEMDPTVKAIVLPKLQAVVEPTI